MNPGLQVRAHDPRDPKRSLRAVLLRHALMTEVARRAWPGAEVWRVSTEGGTTWVLRRGGGLEDFELAPKVAGVGGNYRRARWTLGVLVVAEVRRRKEEQGA